MLWRKRMRCICLILVFAVSASFAVYERAYAEGEVDFDYNGEIDAYTGTPLEKDDGEEVVEQTVTLSDGVIYDRESEMYRYPVGEGFFHCSVYTGMVVTGGVALSVDEGVDVIIYKDGKKGSKVPDEVTEQGAYVVTTGGESGGSPLMNFRIVETPTGKLERYDLPSGFALSQVTIDGEKVGSSGKSVEMMRDGEYEISYFCKGTGAEYVLSLTVDHTPPGVKFEGVDKENEARGPVKISGLSDTDFVTITRDGEETELNFRSSLTESGKYHVVVTDEAGNSVEKDFRILIYLNVQAWIFFGVLLLVAAGVFAALWITRKRIRVR